MDSETRRHLSYAAVFSVLVLCWILSDPACILAEDDPAIFEIRQLLVEVDSLVFEWRIDTASTVAESALVKARQHFGESDSLVASALGYLSVCYHHRAMYAEAESLSNEALAIREEVFGPDHPEVAASLHALGVSCYKQARYEEAKSYHTRALEIREKALGPSHVDVAKSLRGLAVVIRAQGRLAEAEELLERSLEISESALEHDDPDLPAALNNLAACYMSQDKLVQAEPLLRRALDIREESLRPDHPLVAASLYNLGVLYHRQGRYVECEQLYRRALQIAESNLGPSHRDVAGYLNSLANLCRHRGNYAEAESLHRRALSIREVALGPDHPLVAQSLNNLANLLLVQDRFQEAKPLYERALHIKEKAVGYDHPSLALSIKNLAAFYVAVGDYTEGIKLCERALGIFRRSFGSEHSGCVSIYLNLVEAYAALGEYDKCLQYYSDLQQLRQRFVEYVFTYASEDQKMRYTEEYPLLEHSLFSFAILANSNDARATALEMLLKGKAAVLDAVAAEREMAYRSYDGEIQDRVRKHAETCGEISTLILAVYEGRISQEDRDHLQALYRTKDSLETELSSSCAEFRDEMAATRFTVADVAEALPDGAALIEFVRYDPHDFGKTGIQDDDTGPPRYAAFTLDHAGNITLTDLGNAEDTDSLVRLARDRIYKARAEVYSPLASQSEKRLNSVTGDLYDRLIKPLESSLGGATDIFISPDGQLSLLPFEILYCPDDRFLIERYKISYLSSGRDLLRFEQRRKSGDRALVMADPDFSFSGPLDPDTDREIPSGSVHFAAVNRISRGASGCLSTNFDPLPLSRKEAESISETLGKKAALSTDVYCGVDALEGALKSITTAPRILHLATHGYFCPDPDPSQSDALENPLLRSGLALAGANSVIDSSQRAPADGEDGILTAFEASGLNLIGTELVVLSACESGVGQVRNGEGVYGLRRAFQCAGARTVVMSLWRVPDKETSHLMNTFYAKWLSGESKKEALRQSALEVLDSCRSEYGISHPLLWAGFVMLGAPD